MAVLLAIDYGHKKIGFAIGQTVTGTATPLAVVRQNGEMWRKIDAIFDEWHPRAVVVGEPKLADGKPHPLDKMIKKFIVTLKAKYDVGIYREDETLTSFEAGDYRQHKLGKRAPPVDAHAAALFLESWMRVNHQC